MRCAVVDDALHARVQREARRRLGQCLRERIHPLAIHRRRDFLGPVGLDMPAPVHGELVAARSRERHAPAAGLFEAAAVVLHDRRGLAFCDEAVLLEALAVDLPCRSRAFGIAWYMIGCVAAGSSASLCPEAAVADEVDHDVLAEFHAVVEREPRDENHRLRVVRVHVENRRLDHLGDVAAVEC
jgi:hypothetical protein